MVSLLGPPIIIGILGVEVTWYLFDRVMTWLNRNDIISLLTDNNNNNLLLHWKDRLQNNFFIFCYFS